MRSVVVLAAVAALVAGCSDPKTASKKNFETAINDWIIRPVFRCPTAACGLRTAPPTLASSPSM